MEAARLQQEIVRRFGLRPQERWDRDLVQAMAELGRRHGLDGRRLAAALSSDPRLMRELAGLLTIEETFFFRFPEQLAAAVRHVGERWWRSPAEGFVIWSAGCSTGEEPYSLAIGLHDAFGPLARRCRVLACDINADAIARAREGVYGNWSFRGVAPNLRDRCFAPVDGGRHRLLEPFRSLVEFQHLAVQELGGAIPERAVEVVLFRNVGVYLDEPALRQCYAAFARVLRQDGLLIQAATDPTPPTERFVRGEGMPVGAYQLAALQRPRRPPSIRPARLSSIPPPIPNSPASLRPPPHIDALLLGDRGDLEQALQASNRVVTEDPTAPAGFVLRAQIYLAADRANEAVDDLRRALFLDPESWLTRYWYVLALRSADQTERAEGQLRDLLRQLAQRSTTEVLEDGVTQVGELRAALTAIAASYH
ncbi:MAG: hypothetical protein JW751_00905 [Polyangiaceae bacterium]|nr:hypothetical protein [Polyangiaceae bacterium]